jgi:hypothetical protein
MAAKTRIISLLFSYIPEPSTQTENSTTDARQPSFLLHGCAHCLLLTKGVWVCSNADASTLKISLCHVLSSLGMSGASYGFLFTHTSDMTWRERVKMVCIYPNHWQVSCKSHGTVSQCGGESCNMMQHGHFKASLKVQQSWLSSEPQRVEI